MKKIYFIILLIISNFSNSLYAQKLIWAKKLGGDGISVVVDSKGNVYTMGLFDGTSDFDPGPGTYNLSANGLKDMFISKLDSAGNFVWVKQIGPRTQDYSSFCEGLSLDIDASGNIYTTGSFLGTIDFEPGPGTYSLTGDIGSNIFVSKLDPSGNFVWAKQFGNGRGKAIAIDARGNVYLSGEFSSTADFDPGLGIYDLTSTGDYDIYVSKLEPSGNFVWAKKMGGVSGENLASMAIDGDGNVFATGGFQGTADFDPGPGTYNMTAVGLSFDIFVSRLDAAGNFVWANHFGAGRGTYIAVDNKGNILATGLFLGTADFDPGPGTNVLTGNGCFVSKMSASENFLWVKSIDACPNSIAVDAAGNVYSAGSFSGTVDFDPGLGTYYQSSTGPGDMFVSRLDAAGNFIWAYHTGGTDIIGRTIAGDFFGYIYVTGWFSGTIDFDPGPGIYNLTTTKAFDVYVVKLDGGTPAMADNSNVTINVFPNPVFNSATISFSLSQSSRVSARIFDAIGRTVAVPIDGSYPAGNNTVVWNAPRFSAGVYFLKIQTESEVQTKKLVLIR